MNLSDDDFALFGLPRRQQLDLAGLADRWRALQAQVHPDRFAADGAAAQRLAMQWAVRVNEAYQRLKNPLSRGAYLCQLAGADVAAESNTAMPAAFLMQQMHWREALDEAADAAAVQVLDDEVAGHERDLFAQLQAALDERADAPAAAGLVRALMFTTKFRADIAKRLDSLEA